MEKRDWFKVFVRLLFVQGLINRRGMQNLGLVSALSQAGGKLRESNGDLLDRHLEYFNSNPNFVPLVVGGILRLEEDRLAGKPVSEKDIAHFKKTLASPFAAMGDLLFVGGLRPLSLTLACVFAIYSFPIGLLAVFLLHNLTIIFCRFWGLHFGYAKGWELVEVFSGPRFPRALRVIQGIGACVGGVLVGTVFRSLPDDGRWMIVFGGVLTATTLYLLKRQVLASWFALILFPVCALLTWLFGRFD